MAKRERKTKDNLHYVLCACLFVDLWGRMRKQQPPTHCQVSCVVTHFCGNEFLFRSFVGIVATDDDDPVEKERKAKHPLYFFCVLACKHFTCAPIWLMKINVKWNYRIYKWRYLNLMRDGHEKSSFSLVLRLLSSASQWMAPSNEWKRSLFSFVSPIHPNFCHHLNYEILRLKHRISMHRPYAKSQVNTFVDILVIQSELRWMRSTLMATTTKRDNDDDNIELMQATEFAEMSFSENFGLRVSRTHQPAMETVTAAGAGASQSVTDNIHSYTYTSMAKSRCEWKIFCLLNIVRANFIRIARSYSIFHSHPLTCTTRATATSTKHTHTCVFEFFMEFRPSHKMSVLSTANHSIQCFAHVSFSSNERRTIHTARRAAAAATSRSQININSVAAKNSEKHFCPHRSADGINSEAAAAAACSEASSYVRIR